MKTKEKDECSYSFSNAIRTLVMGYVDKKDTQQKDSFIAKHRPSEL